MISTSALVEHTPTLMRGHVIGMHQHMRAQRSIVVIIPEHCDVYHACWEDEIEVLRAPFHSREEVRWLNNIEYASYLRFGKVIEEQNATPEIH